MGKNQKGKAVNENFISVIVATVLIVSLCCGAIYGIIKSVISGIDDE
jgi:hypothetical protein